MKSRINPYGSNDNANIQYNDYEYANNSFNTDDNIDKVLNRNILYDNLR